MLAIELEMMSLDEVARVKQIIRHTSELTDYLGLDEDELLDLVVQVAQEWTAYNATKLGNAILDAVGILQDRYCHVLDANSTTADYAEELAMQYIDDCGDKLPAWISCHVDWQAVWDRELRYDYTVYELATHTVILSNY
jgi:hypothetical protein